MKLRRHQKDTSWVSERYTTNKSSPVRGTIFPNIPQHIPSVSSSHIIAFFVQGCVHFYVYTDISKWNDLFLIPRTQNNNVKNGEMQFLNGIRYHCPAQVSW